MSQSLPLDGVRILDLTRLLPGPYATQLLADLGAEVIKIEEPTVGDYFRDDDPKLQDGTSHVFATLNRNKKSVTLDLKDDRGRAAFMQLVEDADAIVEGFRPDVVDRLGIDYDAVREYNESIVYCSVSGYGQDGPYEQWVGHDINYIGIGGLLHMTGTPDEDPVVPGVPVADYAGGMMLAFSVMAGLWQATTTGEGRYFDVSMTDVIVSWLSLYAPLSFDEETETPDRGQTQPAGKYPCYTVYETKDEKYLTVGAMEYKFWERLCEELGHEEFANRDDHYPEGQRREEVQSALDATFKEHTREAWLERFDPTEVPIAPVNDLDEMWEDPQVQSRGMVQELTVDGQDVPVINTPLGMDGGGDFVRTAYPRLGEHSRELLLEAGVDNETIDKLLAEGVIREEEG